MIAPTLSLNMFENVKIVMKAGTAQGRRKITPKIRFPLMNGWLAIIAVKIPSTFAKSMQISPDNSPRKNRTEG